MEGDDLRDLRDDEDEERERSDDEREEKDSVALAAEERKRVVDEAEEEEAAAVAAHPKTEAAMDLVDILCFEAVNGTEGDGSVSCRDKRSAIWSFLYCGLFKSSRLFPINLKPCLATRFCKSKPVLGCNA